MKELILITAILAVICGGIIYWHWHSDKEMKALLKRIAKSPAVAAVFVWGVIFGSENKDNN